MVVVLVLSQWHWWHYSYLEGYGYIWGMPHQNKAHKRRETCVYFHGFVVHLSTMKSWLNHRSLALFHKTNLWYHINYLTHLHLVPHICVSELYQHWFRQWLVACSAPSHSLNQCWGIVNWTIGNKLQWNSIKNSNILIQENAFEDVVREMAAILSRGEMG